MGLGARWSFGRAPGRKRVRCHDLPRRVHARSAGLAVGEDLEDRLHQLTPGVDPSVFRPGVGRDRVRERLGVGSAPVVVCVSRLMPRKGQDTLIRCWPAVLASVPDARLVIVGGGPSRERLTRLAVTSGSRAR